MGTVVLQVDQSQFQQVVAQVPVMVFPRLGFWSVRHEDGEDRCGRRQLCRVIYVGIANIELVPVGGFPKCPSPTES